MIIRWLDDAIDDLGALRRYIFEFNPAAATRVATKIINAVELLRDHPGMGRQGRVLHTRELIISKTPYIIPYRVNDNSIEILRVLHGAMRWAKDLPKNLLRNEHIPQE